MQTGTQQKLSQFLGLTPLSRCYAPQLPGQRWICWATQHLPMHRCPCPACRSQLWACLQREMETLAFMQLYCFQAQILSRIHQCFDWRVRGERKHVHSTSPLFEVGTAGSGPSPWDKRPHSLLLDVAPPVQSCCAPETFLSSVIWAYTSQTQALVHSWFRKSSSVTLDSWNKQQQVFQGLWEMCLHYIPQEIMQHRWR